MGLQMTLLLQHLCFLLRNYFTFTVILPSFVKFSKLLEKITGPGNTLMLLWNIYHTIIYCIYYSFCTGLYKEAVNLKQRNPNLKVLLTVGGWGMGTKNFSDMVSIHLWQLFIDLIDKINTRPSFLANTLPGMFEMFMSNGS